MKYMIITILLLLLFTGCSRDGENEALFDSLIPPEEVSTMVVFKDLLYAGGVNGLYVINTKAHKLVASYEEEYSMVKDLVVHEDLLYIGHDQGLTIYDGVSFSHIMNSQTNLGDTRVNALLVDTQSRIWIGTYKGIYILEDEDWVHLSSQDYLLHDTIFSLHEDQFGGIWIGHYASPKGGISYTNNGQWLYFSMDDGLPHNNITGFLEHDDRIYASLGFYSDGGIGIFRYENGLPQLDEVITTMWGDNGHKVRSLGIHDDWLWVGTEYDGLHLSKGPMENLFSTNSGLSNNEVKAMVFMDEEVWLGTRFGVCYGRYEDIYDSIEIK